MPTLTHYSECEEQVLAHLLADEGTFGAWRGLNGLQVALMHSYLHLLRHAVGTVVSDRELSKCTSSELP